MSRYFTSPPPVYARNWGNVQNLVELTKIERQIVDSKKVHRKEKKEKRKVIKLKNEKSIKQQNFLTKRFSEESEQVEKSCLTEEQKHYVGYLSDGSENSKKREREASPVVESNIKATPVAGNPLRIRFVFKKPKEAEVVVPQEDRVCSTSGTDRANEISSVNLLSTSLESNKAAIPSESKKRKKHKSTKESRHNSLFDDWVPPCISMEEEDSTRDDWLFGAKRQVNTTTKSSMNTGEDMVINLQKSGD